MTWFYNIANGKFIVFTENPNMTLWSLFLKCYHSCLVMVNLRHIVYSEVKQS